MTSRVGGKLHINNDEFERLRKIGWSQKKIAKALGVSESTISKYKRERGLAK